MLYGHVIDSLLKNFSPNFKKFFHALDGYGPTGNRLLLSVKRYRWFYAVSLKWSFVFLFWSWRNNFIMNMRLSLATLRIRRLLLKPFLCNEPNAQDHLPARNGFRSRSYIFNLVSGDWWKGFTCFTTALLVTLCRFANLERKRNSTNRLDNSILTQTSSQIRTVDPLNLLTALLSTSFTALLPVSMEHLGFRSLQQHNL